MCVYIIFRIIIACLEINCVFPHDKLYDSTYLYRPNHFVFIVLVTFSVDFYRVINYYLI